MNWDRYIDIAKSLHALGTEEAKRSCISRAYYALYNQARTKAAITGFENSDSSHSKVWEALNKLGGDARKISNVGAMLKKQRKWADYDETYPENLDLQSRAAIQLAVNAIDGLKSL